MGNMGVLDKCVEQNKMADSGAESNFQYHSLAAAIWHELQTLTEHNLLSIFLW